MDGLDDILNNQDTIIQESKNISNSTKTDGLVQIQQEEKKDVEIEDMSLQSLSQKRNDL